MIKNMKIKEKKNIKYSDTKRQYCLNHQKKLILLVITTKQRNFIKN